MIIDRDNIKILLIILVVGLGLGYAYINSDLNINGTARVDHANWDVHWANIQVTNGSVSGSNVVTAPTISNQTTVNYAVTLPAPGSFYEFTVDAVNAGVIDTMIDSISSKLNGTEITNLPAYLNYTVSYSDGTPLEQNHQLLANTTETYKVRLEYRNDIAENQLPTSNQTLNLQFMVTYRQANNDSIPVRNYVYTINADSSCSIGDAIPNNVTQYSSASDAMAAFGNRPFYLKHLLRNGIIEDTYVEFVITPAMAQANSGMTAGTYSLRGFVTYDSSASSTNYCNSEYYDANTGLCINPYYESNKAALLSAFGSSRCGENEYSGNKIYYCSVTGLTAYACSNGDIPVYDDTWDCRINYMGISYCDN